MAHKGSRHINAFLGRHIKKYPSTAPAKQQNTLAGPQLEKPDFQVL